MAAAVGMARSAPITPSGAPPNRGRHDHEERVELHGPALDVRLHDVVLEQRDDAHRR
jgi:hypothetical protein